MRDVAVSSDVRTEEVEDGYNQHEEEPGDERGEDVEDDFHGGGGLDGEHGVDVGSVSIWLIVFVDN